MTAIAFSFGENTAGVWVTELTRIISYRYKKHFYHIGEFSLCVLGDDPGDPSKVQEGMILYISDKVCDSLVITGVSVKDGRYTFTGYDMKYILTQRITLFPPEEIEAGTYGYDCRQGWTGRILEGYINYNICEADDEKRRMPGAVCVSGDIGISDDTYMSRLQPLNEVAEALCENAKIGYDVSFSPGTGTTTITVFSGKDNRYWGYPFGTGYGNVDSIKLSRGNDKLKNTVWAVNGTNADNSVVTAVHLGENAAGGFDRRETVAQMNCDQEDIEIYARHAVESCIPTKEIDISGEGGGYGELFNVGDAVRVFLDADTAEEMRISSVEKNYSVSSERVKVYFEDYENPSAERAVLNTLSNEQKQLEKEALDQTLSNTAGEAYTAGEGVYINDDNVIQLKAPDQLHEKMGGVWVVPGGGLSVAGDGGLNGVGTEKNQLGMIRIGDGLEYHAYNDEYTWQSTSVRIGEGLKYVENEETADSYEKAKNNRFRGRRFQIACGENMGFDEENRLIYTGSAADNGIVIKRRIPGELIKIDLAASRLGTQGAALVYLLIPEAEMTIAGKELNFVVAYDIYYTNNICCWAKIPSLANYQFLRYSPLYYLPNRQVVLVDDDSTTVTIPGGIYYNATPKIYSGESTTLPSLYGFATQETYL